MNRLAVLLACTAVLAPAACTSSAPGSGPPSGSDPASPTASGSGRPAVRVAPSAPVPPPAGLARCPVTRPSRTGPPGVSPEAFFGWGSSYGNGTLWVGGLGTHGLVRGVPDTELADRPIGIKFGWWRRTTGQLRITGRRLDGAAGPVVADVPDGYGERGFQASGVYFPAEGCWQVTGELPGARLTFVIYVLQASL